MAGDDIPAGVVQGIRRFISCLQAGDTRTVVIHRGPNFFVMPGPAKVKPKANCPKKISRNLRWSRFLPANYIPHRREAGVRPKPAELGSEGIPSQRWQVLPRHLALMPAKSENLMTGSSERNMTDTPSEKSFFFLGFPESRTAQENPLFQWLGG